MAGRRSRLLSTLTAAAMLSTAVLVACSASDTEEAGCRSEITLGELPADDVRLRPFADGSAWREPAVTGDLPEGVETSPETSALRAGTDGTESDLVAWLNVERYSIPIVQADPCDPVVTLIDDDEDLSYLEEVRIPADAVPADGEDKHLMVVQPDGTTMLELWAADRRDRDTWDVGRAELVDLTGSGIGPDNGVRAYGGSAVGGLIRAWEVDPEHPNYTDGVIRHPLAIALPASLLRYDGGDPGYDVDGYGMARGYVSPATEQDFDSPWSYHGVIPMGARIVIPSSVDLDDLDLPPEARPIAQALQDYGAYVVDRAGEETVSFYAEPSVPEGWASAVRGHDGGPSPLDAIRAELVVVVPEPSGT